MPMIAPTAAAASLITLAVLIAPSVDLVDCRTATVEYDEATAKLVTAIQAYEKCVGESHGRNKCTAEMQAVDDAHDDFEEAVGEFGESCPKK